VREENGGREGAGDGNSFIGATLPPWPTAPGHAAVGRGARIPAAVPRGGSNLAPPGSTNPGAEDEGVAAVEGDGWLDED
jgi:hypothetical protein